MNRYDIMKSFILPSKDLKIQKCVLLNEKKESKKNIVLHSGVSRVMLIGNVQSGKTSNYGCSYLKDTL